LKQDFNGSRFFGLDSWLSWVDFNLFVGSKGISSCGFTSKTAKEQKDYITNCYLLSSCIYKTKSKLWKKEIAMGVADKRQIEASMPQLSMVCTLKAWLLSWNHEWKLDIELLFTKNIKETEYMNMIV
jgi:hypothetical protein